jgi:YVTN family beta-propeller protein
MPSRIVSLGIVVVTSLVAVHAGADKTPAVTSQVVREGLAIDFEIGPADRPSASVLREGETAAVAFTIRDAGSRSPIPNLSPAAWLTLARSDPDAPRARCSDQARNALSPTFLARPEVDLNAYYVLALNADATITVVDPLFGFGGTKLLALVPLASPGEDWALTADQNRLFVSMPAAGRVAVVDTRSWTVVAGIETGGAPGRLALQPDEGYLWVARPGAEGGVTAIRLDTLRVAARIETGRGPHQLAFSDDNRFALVGNGDAGTVSIVDVRSLRKIGDVDLGSRIGAIAWSPRAGAAYVSLPDAGAVANVDVESRRVVARIPTEPGAGSLEFGPDGRLGFLLNPRRNTVVVFDAATNRVIRTAGVEKGPDQIAFSSRFAYVRGRDSEIVTMIALEDLAVEGRATALLDFPGGQHVFGEASRTSPAPSIVRSASENAVLVGNARDRAIYYYQEGMAAPMGQFSNYGREPIAVRIVDRSLRETRPGVYQTLVSLPGPGDYDAILVVDSPRVIHCFPLSIAPSANRLTDAARPAPRVEALSRETTVRSGAPVRIAVRVTDERTGKPLAGAGDAHALIVAAGVWQVRERLEPEADGVYALTIVPPSSGRYEVYVTCPSWTLPYRRVFAFDADAPAQ